MTFSLLARDSETGAIGGVAATGSLCVGGWVLRGRWGAGMSASQGAAPSTFWGEEVLGAMAAGQSAEQAIAHVTEPDEGRDWRQLAALSMDGVGAGFTGARNTAPMGCATGPGCLAAGNLLSNDAVVEAILQGYDAAAGDFGRRLLAALRAGEQAGSDARGLQSAALLILRPDQAPLTLRVDYHPENPISALETLYDMATSGDYGRWAQEVPCLNDRTRVLRSFD